MPDTPENCYTAQGSSDCVYGTQAPIGSWSLTQTSVVPYGDSHGGPGSDFAVHGTSAVLEFDDLPDERETARPSGAVARRRRKHSARSRTVSGMASRLDHDRQQPRTVVLLTRTPRELPLPPEQRLRSNAVARRDLLGVAASRKPPDSLRPPLRRVPRDARRPARPERVRTAANSGRLRGNALQDRRRSIRQNAVVDGPTSARCRSPSRCAPWLSVRERGHIRRPPAPSASDRFQAIGD
jgi:hypothetical protein